MEPLKKQKESLKSECPDKNETNDSILIEAKPFDERQKMLELKENLIAVEDDRISGRKGYTVDELNQHLSSMVAGTKTK